MGEGSCGHVLILLICGLCTQLALILTTPTVRRVYFRSKVGSSFHGHWTEQQPPSGTSFISWLSSRHPVFGNDLIAVFASPPALCSYKKGSFTLLP